MFLCKNPEADDLSVMFFNSTTTLRRLTGKYSVLGPVAGLVLGPVAGPVLGPVAGAF